MKRRTAIVVLQILILLVPMRGWAQSTPQPRSAYEVIQGFNVPDTPAELDRLAIVRHWFGPPGPSPEPLAILILVPGFFGGAEDFRYVGRRLVTRLPWLQVWAMDRRNNLLENRCGMEMAQALGNPAAALGYYLGGVSLPGCPPRADADETTWNGGALEFAVSQTEAAGVGMARWGIATQVEDLRRLITLAHSRYPRAGVYLGGHSLGGMTAQIYAAWRFGDTPETAGWRTLDGLVLIDGGVNGPGWPALVAQYAFEKSLVNGGSVYWDMLAIGRSPFLGLFAEIGGMAASLMPQTESLLWQALPAPFTWPDPFSCPTNKALLAVFTDDNTGSNPDFLMHQGTLSPPVGMCAPPNEARFLLHWLDFDEVTPPELSSTDEWARALWTSRDTNAVEWYFSIMLNADIDLASNLDSTAPAPLPGTPSAFQLEGHRVFDRSAVAVPVYAFAADECRERFEWYQDVSAGVSDFTLIDRSNTGCPSPASVPYAHLDPLFAFDGGRFTNAFIASLADWLRVHALPRGR